MTVSKRVVLADIEAAYRIWERTYGDPVSVSDQLLNLRTLLGDNGYPANHPIFFESIRVGNFATQDSISGAKRERIRSKLHESGGAYFPPFAIWHPDVGHSNSDGYFTVDGHTRQHVLYHDFGRKEIKAYILYSSEERFRHFLFEILKLNGMRVNQMPVDDDF